MPHRYERIRDSMREQHPDLPLIEIKRRAAATYESTRKPQEAHLATAAKRERAKRSR